MRSFLRKNSDLIQAVLAAAAIMGFIQWIDSRFVHAELYSAQIAAQQVLNNKSDEAQRELKTEVDALYLKNIPEPERITLRHPGYVAPIAGPASE